MCLWLSVSSSGAFPASSTAVTQRDPGWTAAGHLKNFLGKNISQVDPGALLTLTFLSVMAGADQPPAAPCVQGLVCKVFFCNSWAVVACLDPSYISTPKDVVSNYLPCQ